MRRIEVQFRSGRRQRKTRNDVLLKEIPKPVRRVPHRRRRNLITEVGTQPFDGDGQQSLGGRFVTGSAQRAVQAGDHLMELPVSDSGGIDCGADQVVGKAARLEIQHTLAETTGPGRRAVVRNPGRQHGDQLSERSTFVPVQVVPNRAVINQQDGPGVMGMHRVRVLPEPGMQNLGNPVERWSPGSDLRPAGHVKIVQDLPGTPGRR